MKRIKFWMPVFVIMAMMSILTGCKTGTFASEYGKDDIAYVSVVSSDAYAGKNVEVIVDGNTRFSVKVGKAKQSTEKHNGKLYGIRSGKRHLRVVSGGNVVYDKDIFVSSQQTKLIIL